MSYQVRTVNIGYSSTNANNINSGTLSSNILATSGVSAGVYGGGNTIPSITVDAKGRITSAANNSITITARTPTSNSDIGTAGEVCYDSTYMYICVSANTWKRILTSTW